MDTSIVVKGARQHNLKNVDLTIPKNKLIVFTGVSGSGKSSMAMDTIYAEGQRRYVESLSAYARQFLGVMDKPEVESIDGLSPAIAIDQKTTSNNPRSTVGTVTEIYDYLRLLYARIGHQLCPNCGREISRQDKSQISQKIIELITSQKDFSSEKGVRVMILSPVVRDKKGEFSDLFENLKKQGYTKARIDGVVRNLNEKFSLIKTNRHYVDAVISRHTLSKKKSKEEFEESQKRISESVESALRLGEGSVMLCIVKDKDLMFPETPKDLEDHLFSENFACPFCNISFFELEPRSFSFNSPHGACPACLGLGNELLIDEDLVLNQNLTLAEGAILPWGSFFQGEGWMFKVLTAVSEKYNFSMDVPVKELSEDAKKLILYGTSEKFPVMGFSAKYEGVIPNLTRRHKETKSEYMRGEIEKFMFKEECKTCKGTRLKEEVLHVLVNGKNIWEVSKSSVTSVKDWIDSMQLNISVSSLSENEKIISTPIVKEISLRLQFLIDVGLSYLTIARSASELSGGEAQRIRLASQIGSGLSGVLYVLDEPSIGLHQRDQDKLIQTLKRLRDLGNTVLVVEHDEETMLQSDYIVDFGPAAGEFGGTVVSSGTPQQIMKDPNSITGKYLSGKRKVGEETQKLSQMFDDEDITKNLKKIHGHSLTLHGASGHNLKNVKMEIPLGNIVCVTGVSGSGKSTLVMDTLYKALRAHFGLKNDTRPEPYKLLEGVEYIDKMVAIDQSPIGRTPKSNPATYTKTFDLIRDLFSKTQEARIRGYGPGRFSFNVKGGRCEACGGEGQLKIEMQFMPDVYINCDVCKGKRYNKEALEITYKGKNISEVLDMTVDEAIDFFENQPQIKRKLQTISDVGLGYIRLGQPATTLSGGEAQRVKLSTELSKRMWGSTLYILDEPTTGLHFHDLERLIAIFRRLKSKGCTVLVIEHNLDVIANSDWIIDLGPEGGDAGGKIIYSGPSNEILDELSSYTGQFLLKAKK